MKWDQARQTDGVGWAQAERERSRNEEQENSETQVKWEEKKRMSLGTFQNKKFVII